MGGAQFFSSNFFVFMLLEKNDYFNNFFLHGGSKKLKLVIQLSFHFKI